MPTDKQVALEAALVEELFANGTPRFLPGEPCDKDAVRGNLRLGVWIDDVNPEERALILSTLPRDVAGILLSPLASAVGTSRVFTARYKTTDGTVSRRFVLKFGRPERIEVEASAIARLAAPFIGAVSMPVVRRTDTLALIAQDLAGLTPGARLQDMRTYIAESDDDPGPMIHRLFDERFAAWYGPDESGVVTRGNLRLGDVFVRHLEMATRTKQFYPTDWADLQQWTADLSGQPWRPPDTYIRALCDTTITTPITVVHGDLHTQNVLVDGTGECWPIDFEWCRQGSSPVVDLAMLECSLKFLAIPFQSDLRTILATEWLSAQDWAPVLDHRPTPYGAEHRRVVRAVTAVRTVAQAMDISWRDYRRALCVMTYALGTHGGLNRPYVLGTLQMLSGLIEL